MILERGMLAPWLVGPQSISAFGKQHSPETVTSKKTLLLVIFKRWETNTKFLMRWGRNPRATTVVLPQNPSRSNNWKKLQSLAAELSLKETRLPCIKASETPFKNLCLLAKGSLDKVNLNHFISQGFLPFLSLPRASAVMTWYMTLVELVTKLLQQSKRSTSLSVDLLVTGN